MNCQSTAIKLQKDLSESIARISLVLLVILLAATTTPADPLADTSKSSKAVSTQSPTDTSKPVAAARFVRIPIFYMTDRAVGRHVFGTERKAERDSIYNLYCGKLDYAMPNYKRQIPSSYEETLGWTTCDKPGKLPLSHTPFTCDSDQDIYEKFTQAIFQAAKQSGNNEVFVCVHGFNTSFARAASDAARLAYNVQRPVILYSWPSTAKLLQYAVDCGNNEWSQEHFNRLMEELIYLKKETGIKINLVAHSMGNRLAVRSIPVISRKKLFDQVFLVDPDFDAETFFHYVVRYMPHRKDDGQESDEKMKVRILFSRKDRALPVAQLIFGGYTRLGQAADTMIETLINPIQMPDLLGNTADFIVKHSPLASNTTPKEPSGMRQHMRDKFEWIDFTTIDHGIIGHSIPYEMIASLWSSGKPGPGLALIADKADAASGLTQMIAKNFKLKERIGELGHCQKVVLVKTEPSKPSAPQLVSSP